VKLRVANADGNDEPVPMDSRLEGVVEKMFDRCIKDRQYKQVLNVYRVLHRSSVTIWDLSITAVSKPQKQGI